jgi:hypothetical protein
LFSATIGSDFCYFSLNAKFNWSRANPWPDLIRRRRLTLLLNYTKLMCTFWSRWRRVPSQDKYSSGFKVFRSSNFCPMPKMFHTHLIMFKNGVTNMRLIEFIHEFDYFRPLCCGRLLMEQGLTTHNWRQMAESYVIEPNPARD